jgi:hypothetical protein
MVYDGLVDGDDADSGELVVTFGMLRSDLIEMLAEILVSSSGLESIAKSNSNLSQSDMRLLATAIENCSSLTSMFSLSGDVSSGEIDAGARKIYARLDLINQMNELHEALRKTIMEDRNMTPKEKRKELCNDDISDTYISELFGDEYC